MSRKRGVREHGETDLANAIMTELMTCPAEFLDATTAGALREYALFVALKYADGDTRAPVPALRPSGRVDEVWHAHLLLPQHYVRMCHAAAAITGIAATASDTLMHHNPATEQQPERAAAYTRTLARYTEAFGEQPNPLYWPAPAAAPAPQQHDATAITVRNLSGNEFRVPVDADTTVRVFMERVHAATGVPPEQQRLLYAGRQLPAGDQDNKMMAELHVPAVVHLVLKLRGC